MGLIGSRNVTVVLTPDAVSAAVVSRGRVVRSATAPLNRGTWDRAWNEGLLPYDRALQSVLRQINAGSHPHVRVLGESPTSSVEVAAVSGQGAAALSAAKLRVEDQHTGPVVMDAHVLAEAVRAGRKNNLGRAGGKR